MSETFALRLNFEKGAGRTLKMSPYCRMHIYVRAEHPPIYQFCVGIDVSVCTMVFTYVMVDQISRLVPVLFSLNI